MLRLAVIMIIYYCGTISTLPYDLNTEHQLETQANAAAAADSESGLAFKLPLPTTDKAPESVILEEESLLPKVLKTSYDNTQKKTADLTEPIPILDTIHEYEKYGNNGDLFNGVSRAIINGYEAFSNLLNAFIQTPKEVARTVSKGITAKLDIIGGKLVGL